MAVGELRNAPGIDAFSSMMFGLKTSHVDAIDFASRRDRSSFRVDAIVIMESLSVNTMHSGRMLVIFDRV